VLQAQRSWPCHKNFLGITIHYNPNAGTLDLLQPDKITELSDEFGLTDCKPLSSPLPAGCNLDVIKTTPPSSVKLPYHHIVGALLWIALASCPDILFAMIYLTRFLCGYNHTHFNAACHVLAYLRGTAQQTICYQRTPISSLALCHQREHSSSSHSRCLDICK